MTRITDTLHEDLDAFLIVSRWIPQLFAALQEVP